MTSKQLAVLGHPIDHSLSPVLHAAAYGVLGLDWAYGRQDLTEVQLDEYVTSRDETWIGLSLTMPLKYRAAEIADVVDDATAITGACNTLVFDHETRRLQGLNTDVPALASVIRESVAGAPEAVSIVGGGATAVSAVVAASRAGARTADIYVRDTTRASNAVVAGHACGINVSVHHLSDFATLSTNDVSIMTLPGSVDLDLSQTAADDRILIDVAYSPWHTSRAQQWQASGGRIVGGLHMLVRQAVLQVRVFLSASPDVALDREDEVRTAMSLAVGLGELFDDR
jgi:shikimate dehydrogenase